MSAPNVSAVVAQEPPPATTERSSSPASPSLTRTSSPSPSPSPASGLLSCPSLDRSYSIHSNNSDASARSSVGSRTSSGSAVLSGRRGYVRPQGARFADSARNRDSVMSLGSIAHLQYYFARTGILDGKGAQLAREDHKKRKTSAGIAIADTTQEPSQSSSHLGEDVVQSPIDVEDGTGGWGDDYMLPPTVSTYNHREQYIAPPPDLEVLRSDLKEALAYVTKAVAEVQRQQGTQTADSAFVTSAPVREVSDSHEPEPSSPDRGLHEIQGTHILDVVTLAIKAAREYYLMHAQPQLLAKVKSERQIREELIEVLDALKRMATRNFAGGLRPGEVFCITDWVRKVEDFLSKEKAIEDKEKQDRASWTWLDGDWSGRARLREWEFMKTFVQHEDFPEWDSPEGQHQLPTPFQRAMSNGLTLIHLHNRILQKSKRHFGKIDSFHTDTTVPYRAADNLRYWVKAAELRWEVKLRVDVLSIVYNKEREAWQEFDDAILKWCQTVREEITLEWKQGSVHVTAPVLVP